MKAIYQKNFKKIIRAATSSSLFQPYHPDRRRARALEKYVFTLAYWGIPHSNPFTSTFLYNIHSLSELKKYPVLFCRDGLFTLLDFFHRFPNPVNTTTILITHFDLVSFIPTAWVKNILFYEYGLMNQLNYLGRPVKRDSLLIKICQLSSDKAEDYIQTLEKLKELPLKNFKKIRFFCWSRDDLFLTPPWSRDKDFCERMNSFTPELLKIIKTHNDAKFIDFSTMLSLKDFHKYNYLDQNKKQFYVMDDHLDFLALSQGAQPCQTVKGAPFAQGSFFPLSPYHGFRIIESSELDTSKIGWELGSVKNLRANSQAGRFVSPLKSNENKNSDLNVFYESIMDEYLGKFSSILKKFTYE